MGFFWCFLDFLADWLVCELTALIYSELCNLPLSYPRMGHKRRFQVPNDSRVEISLQCITIPFKGCSPAVLNKSAGFFLMSQ